MAKYRILIDGEEDPDEELFETEEEAEYYANEWVNNWHTGAEILELSNPGDYPYNEDDCPEIEVVEAD